MRELDKATIDELAKWFSNENSARALLLASEYPNDDIPFFPDPQTFWEFVANDISAVHPQRATPLVRAALDLYPSNQVFRGWLVVAEAPNSPITQSPVPPRTATGYVIGVTTDRPFSDVEHAAGRATRMCRLDTRFHRGLVSQSLVSLEFPDASSEDTARVASRIAVELNLTLDRVAVRANTFKDYFLERFVVQNPDGGRFEVSNTPASTPLREIARDVLSGASQSANQPLDAVVIESVSAGRAKRLDLAMSLHENGVRDGDTLHVGRSRVSGGEGGLYVVRDWLHSKGGSIPPEVRAVLEYLFGGKPHVPSPPVPSPPRRASSRRSTASKRRSVTPGIAFIAANPLTTGRLQLDQEFNGIAQVLQVGIKHELVRLQPYWGVQRDQIPQSLSDFGATVFHFSGHGTKDGGLTFGLNSGRISETISPKTLRLMLELVNQEGPVVRYVVLNGCYSATAADELTQVVDLFIGSSDRILDSASHYFSRGFYGGLLDGKSFLGAIEAGKGMMEELRDGLSAADRPGCDPDLIQFRTKPGGDADQMFLLR